MCFIKSLFFRIKFKEVTCQHTYEEKEWEGKLVLHKINGGKETFDAMLTYSVCTKCNKSVFNKYKKI